MDLNVAIEKHAGWKLKLRAAISKQESLDASSIASDRECELGKWLQGDAKSKFGSLPTHAACLKKHAAFHTEAAKVAHAINAKNYDSAEAMLNAGTDYAAASSAISVALMQLKREAKL